MGELRVAGFDAVVATRPGETLLAALNRAGYAARVGCKRGGCGICKVNVADGETTYQTPVAPSVVTEGERQAGTVLLCRAVPDGDVTVALPEGFRFGCISRNLAELARPRN